MRSSDQLRRMLLLVPYLQRHPGVTVAEAAAHFGVREHHLLSDLEVLQFCGLPEGMVDDLFSIDLEATREDGMIYLDNAEVLSAPPRLRASEATSLLVALEALREVATDEEAEVLVRLMSRLSEAFGGARRSVELEIDSGSEAHRRTLREAIAGHHVVELDHRGLKGRTRPRVHPVQLRVLDGWTYLDAWNPERDAWRSYRMDRIAGVEDTGEVFEPRADNGAAAMEWFADETRRVTLTLAPAAAWVAEYHPVDSVERLEDRLVVRMPVGSTQWLVGLLLRLGDDVIDVDDQELVAEAARRATSALRHYDPPVGQ